MELPLARRSSLGEPEGFAHAAQPGRSQVVSLAGAGAREELELGWRGLCMPQIMILLPGERHAGSLRLVCLHGRGNEAKQNEI